MTMDENLQIRYMAIIASRVPPNIRRVLFIDFVLRALATEQRYLIYL
jgi:hypothetical protein